MNYFKILCCFLIFILSQAFVEAIYAAIPLGYWKTIDDSGNTKSIVRITGSTNDLSATVNKLYPPDIIICTACKGDLKNKPILGMTVMYGLKQNTNDANQWSGGTILDTGTGKTYQCIMTVSPDGSQLVMRGYIGIPSFGKSQTWFKVK